MGLAKYILNFDELTLGLKNDLINLITRLLRDGYKNIRMIDVEKLLKEIDELLPTTKYKAINDKIVEYIMYKYDAKQKDEGLLLDIPPIQNHFIHKFRFDNNIYLTGISLNETGWKKNDRFDLVVNEENLISNATIKEIGEHKYFNTYYKVNANSPISFIYKNNSGNNKKVLFNLEYLEGDKVKFETDSNIPTIDDIPNDWDFAVQLDWEKGNTDIDLHGFLSDGTHIYFGNKTGNNIFLNFDFTEHITNQNPEILSVKGNKDKTLEIYLHNYNGNPLINTATVKIFGKGKFGNRLLKTYSVRVGNDSRMYGVCKIDLKMKKIQDNLIIK
ncbi:hypothetical protein [Clostridium botulinum]|uniref:hypothetical protein n=1 Tax=Clostridium botulinum TaxID=1491 RepID=UPI001E2D09CB|nr:hypothetical protein [Clostridium botulinum]MCD3254345.1 hypothetical protein [Clostridium botulinum C/D]MCD3279845.1 hypothetical protein [Clostridium botulinum C/D]MCD3339624.1 hypothetical protein [Clostridium botulinum C/D]MCD3357484.1 hypothetical protein [Clostridium botulinum C/D]